MTEDQNLREIVEENHRALRGSNGTPGLVSDVSKLKEDITEIKENHLPHILAEIGKQTKDVEINLQSVVELEILKVTLALQNLEVKRKATNWDRILQIGTALAIAYLLYKHGL